MQPMYPESRLPDRSAGIAFVLFGGVFVASFFANALMGNNTQHFWTEFWLTLLFGLLPLVVGLYQFWRAGERHNEAMLEQAECRLLQLAVSSHGRITAVDAAILLKTSHEKAKNLLNGLQVKGVFSMDVSESGAVVYSLTDYLPPATKTGP